MLQFHIFVVIIAIGASWAQVPSLSNAIDSLPPELQEKVSPEQVENLKNTTISVFKQKCEKNAGPEVFAKVQEAVKEFPECLTNLVNMTKLTDEIEGAKQNGTVDEVFKRYCDKKSKFKKCFHSVVEVAKPCFTAKEKASIKTLYNVTDHLGEFICYQGGDRIALFIAEGGPECMQSKQQEIGECVNNTLGGQLQGVDMNNISFDNMPEFSFGEKECHQIYEVQSCVAKVLETCTQPTTANIFDSLFKFVRKSTPCKNVPIPSEKKPGSASGLTVTSLTILMTFSVTLFL